MSMEASDQELLRAFVRERSEDAFRQMVNRHLNLVFATARRILGDPQLAEEVAQGVFLLLARKAGEIGNQQPLAGWLYHTARHHALNASRAEGRRRQREQTAAAMQTTETTPEPEWIAAELEGALEELPAEDRDALVLRFLDNRQLREVGVELGISEEAARKRVSRALDKLRGIFGKRGVALSTGLLTTALAAQAGAVAPAGLGASIVASALTGLTAASATVITATQTTTTLMNLLNLKTTAAILGAAAVTGTTTYLVQEREVERVRADYQTLNEAHGKLAAEQQEARELIQLRDEQLERLRRDVADLPRLRGEVDRLNRSITGLRSLEPELAEAHRQLTVLRNQAPASAPKEMAERPASDDGLMYDEAFLVRYGMWTEEAEKKAAIARLNQYRQIGLGLIMYADQQKGWFPANLDTAQAYFPEGLKTNGIELVYTGDVA
ncbi:MAG TPA: sigma-70 family RNA polymerase sigma factor, partial [Verrucomicrobiae bacterium]|nr:sigma-70 family RNA polymerase sigma factor [Verrucomicrobiae bacterium]